MLLKIIQINVIFHAHCILHIGMESWTLNGKSTNGYQSGRIGDAFNLICNIVNRESSDHVSWSRDGIIISTITTQGCLPTSYTNDKYVYSCKHQSYYLEIPGNVMTNKEHGRQWKCLNVYGENSNIFILNIAVPVRNVTIFPTDIVTADAESTIKFTCLSDLCRPPANIVWIKNGKKVKTDVTTELVNHEDYYITISNASIKVHIEDNGSVLYCFASNLQTDDLAYSDNVSFSVNYSPQEPPFIKEYTEEAIWYEDETVLLTCISRGGNPIANLSWDCFGIHGVFKERKEEAISEILLTTHINMNNTSCICSASHSVNNYYSQVDIIIYIRATRVIVIGQDHHSNFVNERQPMKLECDLSYLPSPNSIWIGRDDKYLLQNGSAVQPPVIKLKNITCLDAGKYSCILQGMVGNVTLSTNVFVNCKPMLLNKSTENIRLKQDERLEIWAHYLSYPRANVTLTIKRNESNTTLMLIEEHGFKLHQDHQSHGSILRIVKARIQSDDFGQYNLLIINAFGELLTSYTVQEKDITDEAYQRNTALTTKLILTVVMPSVFAVLILLIVPVVTINLLRKKSVNIDGNREEINTAQGEIVGSSKSTSGVSEYELESFFYDEDSVREYQNDCRVLELAAAEPYQDLEPDEPDLSYEEVDRTTPDYIEPLPYISEMDTEKHSVEDIQDSIENDESSNDSIEFASEPK